MVQGGAAGPSQTKSPLEWFRSSFVRMERRHWTRHPLSEPQRYSEGRLGSKHNDTQARRSGRGL